MGFAEAMMIQYNLKNKYRLSLRTLYGAKNGIFEDEGDANSSEQAEINELNANEEPDGGEEESVE